MYVDKMKLNKDIICLINKIILCSTFFYLEYLLYYNKIIHRAHYSLLIFLQTEIIF